jgi:hypothetical protein
MTIDERLEKLTERTDALAVSLEILQGMQYANERRFESSANDFEKIKQTFLVVLDSIKGLENIAVTHGERLDDHDERLDDLEKH